MFKKILNIFNQKKNNIKPIDDFITIKICKRWLDKEYSEIEFKLAHLILNGIVFCNDGWWYKEEGVQWKEGSISMHVNCNDVFAWGCADSEDLLYSEVNDLYDSWSKDPDWGVVLWCITKRKIKPQRAIEERLNKEGYDINKILIGDRSE